MATREGLSSSGEAMMEDTPVNGRERSGMIDLQTSSVLFLDDLINEIDTKKKVTKAGKSVSYSMQVLALYTPICC